MPAGIRRSLLRASAAAALVSGPLLVSAALPGPPATISQVGTGSEVDSGPCSVPEISRFLRAHSADRSDVPIVLAYPDIGPELVYRGDVRAAAALYHRTESGIRAALALGEAPAVAKEAVLDRGVDLVLLCPAADRSLLSGRGRGKPPGLYEALVSGVPPQWLEAVPLPPELAGFRLFEVRS